MRRARAGRLRRPRLLPGLGEGLPDVAVVGPALPAAGGEPVGKVFRGAVGHRGYSLLTMHHPNGKGRGTHAPRPSPKLAEPGGKTALSEALRLSGRPQRGDSAWNETLDHLLSLLTESPI